MRYRVASGVICKRSCVTSQWMYRKVTKSRGLTRESKEILHMYNVVAGEKQCRSEAEFQQ